jgi:hypothetical protein
MIYKCEIKTFTGRRRCGMVKCFRRGNRERERRGSGGAAKLSRKAKIPQMHNQFFYYVINNINLLE